MAAEQVTFELREPASPEALLPHDHAASWWLGTALLALVAGIALMLWRNHRHVAKAPQSVRNHAYQEAARDLGQIAAQDPREAAVLASLILRKYLSLAADDPALFETQEEFISRNDALQCLTESARTACAHGFARLASCKYAPQAPDLDSPTVVSESRDLLESLHRSFQG
jgi:hypothetical protein